MVRFTHGSGRNVNWLNTLDTSVRLVRSVGSYALTWKNVSSSSQLKVSASRLVWSRLRTPMRTAVVSSMESMRVELREVDGLELRGRQPPVELEELARADAEILDLREIHVGLDDVLELVEPERAAFDVVVHARELEGGFHARVHHRPEDVAAAAGSVDGLLRNACAREVGRASASAGVNASSERVGRVVVRCSAGRRRPCSPARSASSTSRANPRAAPRSASRRTSPA